MQGIAQRILDRARAPLPVERVVEPVRAVGDVRPGADVREPGDQGVDVAVDALQAHHLIGDPVDRQPAAAGELDEDGLQQVEMRIGQRLAKIRTWHTAQRGVRQPECRRDRARAAGGRAPSDDVVERVAVRRQARGGSASSVSSRSSSEARSSAGLRQRNCLSAGKS